MKKKRYSINGQIYEIPEQESASFLKENPHATEVNYYEVGGNKYNIPVTEADAFEKEMGISQKKSPAGNVAGTLNGGGLPSKSDIEDIRSFVTGESEQQRQKRQRDELMGSLSSRPVISQVKYNKEKPQERNYEAIPLPSGYYAKYQSLHGLDDEYKNHPDVVDLQAKKYDYDTQPLKEIPLPTEHDHSENANNVYADLLQNAAIKWYANNSREFSKDLKAKGVDLSDPDLAHRIPNSKAGQIMNAFVNSKNINDYISYEAPELIPAFLHAKENNITRNPDYGANQVANEVSREIQKSGYNNIEPIFNFFSENSRDYANMIAKNLYENDPKKMQIWNEKIKGNEEKYLDMPSFMEGVGTRIKKTIAGYATTLSLPFKTKSDIISDKWNEEASNVSANPTGVLKYARDVGDIVGLISTITAGANVAGAGSLFSPQNANAISTAAAFGGKQFEEGFQKYPDNPIKAIASGATSTALYTALSYDIFPVDKINKAFSEVKPELTQVAERLASGAISKEAYRLEMNNIYKKAFDIVGAGIKQNTKMSLEFAGIAGLNRGLDKFMGLDEDTFAKYHPEGEVVNTFKSMFLSNAAIAGVAGYGEVKAKNTIMENSLYDAASNPKMYERVIDDAQLDNPYINMNEMRDNLKYLSETKKELDARGMSPDAQKKYLVNSIKHKITEDKIKSIKDKSLKEDAQKNLDALNIEKERILNPETGSKKFIEEMYDNELLPKSDMRMLEDENGKFNEHAVGAYIKYVAQQANNLGEDWTPHTTKAPDVSHIPEQVIEFANERWAKEIKAAKEPKTTSVILPEENKHPNIIEPIKPQENAIPERSAEEIPLGQTPGHSEEMGGGISQPEKSPNAQENQIAGEEKPPISNEPPPSKQLVYFQYPPTQLSHGGVERIGGEHGFEPENKYETNSILKWNKEADDLMEKGFSVQNLLSKVDAGEHMPSPAERVVLTRYAAELQNRLRTIKDVNNPEFNQTLDELQRVANIANFGGSQAGASLGAIGHIKVVPDGSYAEFMLSELAANNNAPLTDAQKESANRAFEVLNEKQQRVEQDLGLSEDMGAELRAQHEIDKIKKSTPKTKKTHDDFVKERKSFIEEIKEAKKKHDEWLKSQGIQKMGGGFTVTPEMVKAITKIVKSYIEEGFSKLEEIVSKVHADIKDDIPEIEEKHIINTIAGEYNEKKPTRREAAIQMENLRIEAQLINKYERLIKGTEPKEEKKKQKRNQEIEALRGKINAFKKEEVLANKFYPEEFDKEYKKLQSLKKTIENKTQKVKEKIAKGDFASEVKKTPIMEDKEFQKKFPELFKQTQKSVDEYIKVKREIALRRLKQMYENKTPQEKTIEVFSKALNVPRTLMASFDFSAPLRQGIVATIAHPSIALPALKFMFEAAKDEKIYNRWLEDVHNSPRWEAAKKTGLGITDPESLHAKGKEEAFQGAPYAEKIPGVGEGVKASERAYVGYLNKLRWDLFNMYADRFEDNGKTFENNPKLYEGLSSFLNSETGRGGMKGLENAAPVFNWFLFASKLISSRINMLGLSDIPNLAVRGATLGKYGLDYGFYTRLPAELRLEAAKDMLKFIGIGMSTIALAKMLGAQVESDPRSSDFGKIHVGNTRWDIWGGFQPYARVLTQFLSAERKTTTTGEIQELNGKGFMAQNRLSPVGTFIRQKLAPVPSTVLNLATGHDATGQPVTITGQLIGNVTPLLAQDIYQGMQDQGVKAIFTVGIPSALGVSVQTFQPRQSSGSSGSFKSTIKSMKKGSSNKTMKK